MEQKIKERKKIVFLSSSFVNLAKTFAEHYSEFDIFLILDRKFPFDFEDMENFYTLTFNYPKLFDKNKEKYFDNLSVFINEFEPDLIICNNFSKLLPKSFLDFMKFRNSKIEILNIHHGDLRDGENYKGLNGFVKEFLTKEEFISTIHLIENEKMDEGKQLAYSKPTDFKELKNKKLTQSTSDIMNLRLKNVILTYHERTKILKLLHNVVIKQLSEK